MNRKITARGSIRVIAWSLSALGLGLAAHASAIPTTAAVAQALLERAFSHGLASHHPERPWPSAETAPVARLAVPRLGVREIVLAGGSGEALAFGPAVVASPKRLGDSLVTVIAGHRDTHFRFVRDLVLGDEITLETAVGATRRYRVTRFQTVRWDRFAVPSGPTRPLLALATCWPFDGRGGGGVLRRVAWAEEVVDHPRGDEGEPPA